MSFYIAFIITIIVNQRRFGKSTTHYPTAPKYNCVDTSISKSKQVKAPHHRSDRLAMSKELKVNIFAGLGAESQSSPGSPGSTSTRGRFVQLTYLSHHVGRGGWMCSCTFFFFKIRFYLIFIRSRTGCFFYCSALKVPDP